MTEIPSTPADGNILVLVVPTIANPDAPTLLELTAASVEDISCFLTGDGLTTGLEEATIADNRLCSTQNREKPGKSTNTLSLTYIDNTNATDVAALNTAKEVLVPGTAQYVVIRRGLPYETAIAVGQTIKLYPIQSGKYNELPPEENSVLRISQKQFVTGDVKEIEIAA